MNKHKPISIFLIITMIVMSLCVSAAAPTFQLSFNSETQSYKIEGTAAAGSNVMLIVFGPDYNAETIENIYYVEEKDNVSNFAFNVDMLKSAKSGTYKFKISVNGENYGTTTQEYNSLGYGFNYSLNKFAIEGGLNEQGGVISVAEFGNITNNEIKSPVLMTGIYEKTTDKLINVAVAQSKNVSSNKTVTLTTSFNQITQNPENYYVKSFLFADFNDITPVTYSIGLNK